MDTELGKFLAGKQRFTCWLPAGIALQPKRPQRAVLAVGIVGPDLRQRPGALDGWQPGGVIALVKKRLCSAIASAFVF